MGTSIATGAVNAYVPLMRTTAASDRRPHAPGSDPQSHASPCRVAMRILPWVRNVRRGAASCRSRRIQEGGARLTLGLDTEGKKRANDAQDALGAKYMTASAISRSARTVIQCLRRPRGSSKHQGKQRRRYTPCAPNDEPCLHEAHPPNLHANICSPATVSLFIDWRHSRR